MGVVVVTAFPVPEHRAEVIAALGHAERAALAGQRSAWRAT